MLVEQREDLGLAGDHDPMVLLAPEGVQARGPNGSGGDPPARVSQEVGRRA
jgi:hypothetical protein